MANFTDNCNAVYQKPLHAVEIMNIVHFMLRKICNKCRFHNNWCYFKQFNVKEENQNNCINSIEFDVENKTVAPVQDIETLKPLTKKIPRETIKAKYISMEVFHTFYDNYVNYKDYVKDILSTIQHNDDVSRKYTLTIH